MSGLPTITIPTLPNSGMANLAASFMDNASKSIEGIADRWHKRVADENKLAFDEKTLAETIRHNQETTKAEYAKLQNALLLQQMSDDEAMKRELVKAKYGLMQASMSARNSGPKSSDVRAEQTSLFEKTYLAALNNSYSKMTDELLQIKAMEETSPDTWNDAQKALYNEFQQSVQGTTLEQDAVNDPKKVLNYVKNNHISHHAKRMGLPNPQNIGSWAAFDHAVRSTLGPQFPLANINSISMPEFVKQNIRLDDKRLEKATENMLNEAADLKALRNSTLKNANGKTYDLTTHDELRAILKSVSLFTGISEEKVAKHLIPAARASDYKWNLIGSDVSGYNAFMRLLDDKDFQSLLPQSRRAEMLATMRNAANPEGFDQIIWGPWQPIGLDRGSLISDNLSKLYLNNAR